MSLLLIIGIAVPFLALSLWRRWVGLALFCAVLPAYLVRATVPLPGVGAVPTTLLEALFWALFAAWLFTDGMRPGAWAALKSWAAPMTLLAAAATVGVLLSPEPLAALGLWRAHFLEPMLFFPMFVDVVARSKRGNAVIGALGACVALIGITAIFQKITGYGIPNPLWQAEATRRVTSVFGFPNAIALLAAPVTVLMAGWALTLLSAARGRRKLLTLLPTAAAVLGLLGIVFAVSEGGMIGTAAGLLALGLFTKKLRPWALGAIIAACMVTALYAPATDYAAGIIGFRDDSTSVRGIIWKETAAMLADSPIFGAGLSGYPGRILPYHDATWIEVFQYPHSLALNFWSETGLAGLAAFLWIAIRFFRVSARLGTKGGWIVTANAAAMVTVLVHGLVDVPYLKNDLAFLFWAMIGITESLRLAAERSLLEKAKGVLAGQPWSPWLPKA